MAFSERRKPSISAPAAQEPGRGRHARTPGQLPARGWLDILSRTGRRISVDNVSIVASGVGFYAFVSLVPALAAMIGIYGLVSNPSQVGHQVAVLARVMPHEALPLLQQQLQRITSNTHAAGLSTILGVVIALYSAASATRALMEGLNICYEEQEKRSFIRLYAQALLLTLCAITGAIVAVTLVAVVPPVIAHLNVPGGVTTAVDWVRWLILVVGFVLSLAVVYRYGPSRTQARWAWVSWGAVVATVLWITGSALFSLYVTRFGSYDKTYGSLGAVVVFLMWMYLTAYAVLIGAELNSEMERQTMQDTTEDGQKPLGQRGARSADTIGPSREQMRDEKSRPPSKPRRS